MSLQTKFAVLLSLIGLAVVASVSAALWSFDVLEREASRPFQAVSAVMDALGQMKGHVERINELAAGRPRLEQGAQAPAAIALPGDQESLAAATKLAGNIDAELTSLEANEWYSSRVGRTTSRALREKVVGGGRTTGVVTSVRAWIAEPTPAAAQAVIRTSADAHRLIEAAERHVVEGASASVVQDASIRRYLLVVLGLSFLWAALVSAQGFLLMRRWVTRPVSELRIAAARIGAGDFDHRVPVAGADELGQLSREVNHMAEMVRTMQDERVERERLAAIGEMVRRLAHNLRNPLAGIRGLAEVSRADLPPQSDLRDNQDRIIAAVDRFEKWLRELLNATSPLTIHPEPTPVRPMLEGLVLTHRPVANTRGVELVLDASGAPTEAPLDARHLEQALVALVANAIDASPVGGTVRITASRTPTTWEVVVTDQGAGVRPEIRDQIFKPYFTTKRDGNGIGLAVAQQVVAAHGGRILVEAAVLQGQQPAGAGPGACFRVRLPMGATTGVGNGVATVGHRGVPGGENSGHRG